MDFTPILENYTLYLDGLVTTVKLVFLSLVIGLVMAVPLAVMRTSSNLMLNGPVWAFTYFFRGTPLLVQMFMIYYGLGQWQLMIDLSQEWTFLRDAYWYALFAFTLNTCAYTTEIFRGAIEGMPYGEIEAARACGMSKFQTYRRIILPSAFRRALPAYSNEVIFMLHGSVVASTITIQDLLGVGRWLNGRYYLAYEGFITAAVLYLIIVLLVSRGFRLWESRWLRHLYPQNAVQSKSAKGLASFRV